jgi:hypothetical protein
LTRSAPSGTSLPPLSPTLHLSFPIPFLSIDHRQDATSHTACTPAPHNTTSVTFEILTYSPFIPKNRIADIAQTGLTFKINGEIKQAGTAADMIFDVPHLISFVSGIMKLEVRSTPSLLLSTLKCSCSAACVLGVLNMALESLD